MLVGPWAGALCVTVVLIVQGLLFADGGLTALGLNVINMALVGAFGGYVVFVALKRLFGRNRRSVIVASRRGGTSGNLRKAMAASTKPSAAATFATTEKVSSRMSRQAVRDTAPELAVRQSLFAAGERYRVAFPVPGRPRCTIDVAFPRRKVAVFINGCFWHGCPEHGRKSFSRNETYWNPKILRTQERDQETDELLTNAGWTVLRFWEHEPPATAAERITEQMRARRTGVSV